MLGEGPPFHPGTEEGAGGPRPPRQARKTGSQTPGEEEEEKTSESLMEAGPSAPRSNHGGHAASRALKVSTRQRYTDK